MLHDIANILRQYPQLVVFLALAGGYFLGKIKIYGFNLGATAGVLVVALIIGQINVQIPGLIKTVAFALFIFCIGYRVGPEFFGSIKQEGIKYIFLSLVVAIVGLITALVVGKLWHFDQGTTAGLLGGAMTQSSVIGTADGAIKHLSVSAASKVTLDSNVAIAYAITYIFGTAGLILFFKFIPKLMRLDLKAEAKKLELAMTGGDEKLPPELFTWSSRLDLRSYQVTNKELFNKTISEIEQLFPKQVAIDLIQRGNQIVTPTSTTTIHANDVIALIGPLDEFLTADKLIGPEIYDKKLLNQTGEIIEICVLNKDAIGKTLGELSHGHGHGCFLKSMTRQGHAMPLTINTKIKKCDVLQVSGPQVAIEKLIKYLGFPERPTAITDLVMVGIGCFLGTLLGLIAIPLFNIPITLGIGGGVLVSGLIFGWLRALHPTFGQIPSGAQWLMSDLGLNLFIACVGLVAGPKAWHAIQTSGAAIFLAGIIVTLAPMIIGLLFGKYILRLNPVLLLGALTGAGTITAALNSVKDEADSAIPALGYTVPYAFGNVLLTIWGTLIVYLMR